MRLTLRTLLAYLDDTLEPAEAKLIGQKVAESDTARELMARIKEVTRRRRITTPDANAGTKVDPNTIAGYLDNVLTPEALAELEELALTSDVNLAEIASCHQILTVVLGEPAVVPPTAYKRMYGLAKAPMSDPNHKPPVPKEVEDGLAEGKEVDETLRLGLPALHAGNLSNRMILLGGAACVVILLGVAIWMMLPASMFSGEGDAGPDKLAKASPTANMVLPGQPTEDKKGKTTPKTSTETATTKETNGKDKTPKVDQPQPEIKDKIPDKKDKTPVDEGPAPPNLALRDIGQFEPGREGPAVLLQFLPDKKQPNSAHWTRLLRTADRMTNRVWSNAPLVSLPGYRSVVDLDSGLRLTLWGNVPEISPFPVAIESVVMLHPSDKNGLDLTLLRGRIAVTNSKDQAMSMRLRFANPANPTKGEIWDLTLDKRTELIVNLAGIQMPGEPFYPDKNNTRRIGPIAVLVMVLVAGSASVTMDLQPPDKLLPPPAGPVLAWDSRVGKRTLIKAEGMPPWIQPLPPLPKEVDPRIRKSVLDALDSLQSDLSGPNLETGFANAMKTNDTQKRRLVIRSAGAMDDLQRVIDAMNDKELDVRRAAIETLRIWIGAGRDNDYILFDQLQRPTYNPDEAKIIMTLLHRWSPEEESNPHVKDLLVNYLVNKKVAIRELAHDYLLSLPGMYQPGMSIGYNAVAPEDQVRQRAKEWQALLQKSSK